jgi:ankyrin repeat protein
MKHLLLTTIAAVVLVGCGGPSVDIHQAAIDGDIQAVKQHIAAGTDLNAMDSSTYHPLHFSAREGHKEVVELLIANGARVNAWSRYGTPLDKAVDKGRTEIADLLRKHGAKTAEELKAEGK